MTQEVKIEILTDIQKSVGELKKFQKTATASLKGIETQSKRTSQSVAKTSKTFNLLGDSIKKAGLAFGSFFAVSAIIGGLKNATNRAKDFELAIAEINTLLGENEQLTRKTTATFLRFSEAYGLSARDQAKAFYQIVSAGVKTTSEQLRFLEQSNKAAIAGLTSTAVAADAITSVTNAYKNANLSATDASDKLFIAVREGKTTFEELAGSIGRAAPLASAANVKFSELTGTLAFLTKSGVNTFEAVTGVRAIVASVLKPSVEAAAAAKDLGIQFDISAIKSKGFAGFLKDIIDRSGNSSVVLNKLFGNVRASAAIASIAKGNFEDFNRILQVSATETGNTGEAFNKIAQSDAFKLNQATEKINNSLQKLGAVILPIVADGLKSFATGAKAIVKFLGIGETETDKIIDKQKDLRKEISRTQRLIKNAPIGSSLGTFQKDRLKLLKSQFKGLQDELNKIRGVGTKKSVEQNEVIIKAASTGVKRSAKEAEGLVVDLTKSAVRGAKLIASEFTNALKRPLENLFEDVDFSSIGKKLGGQLNQNQAGTLGSAVGAASAITQGGAQGAKDLLGQGAGALGSAILGPVVGQFAEQITSILILPAEQLQETIRAFFAEIPQILENLLTNAPLIVEEIIAGIPRVIEGIVAKLPIIIRKLIELLPRVIVEFQALMPEVAITFATSLVEQAPRIVTAIVEGIAKAPFKLASSIGGKAKGLLGFQEGGGARIKQVPKGFPNDTFPALLGSEELVIERSTARKLKRLLDGNPGASDSGQGSGASAGAVEAMMSQPIIVQVDGREIARAYRNQVKAGFAV